MPSFFKALIFGSGIAFLPLITYAENPSSIEDQFSLNRKFNVTSVSKSQEDAFTAASAIYVLTGEEIKRSGATSIPEALRAVPGLEVAQIDSNKWAVTSRGFNRQFSNKMLVLIDGRTIYTPLFSGVYWDIQDVMLEDVDRVEVIRGSGATLWGANAVNGVINIVTKDSKLTQGTLLSGTYGNIERGTISGRFGGAVGTQGTYRTYIKLSDHANFDRTNGNSADNSWQQGRAGFRTDWVASSYQKATIQGDIYHAQEGILGALPGVATLQSGTEDTKGGNILARWQYEYTKTSKFTLQSYIDRSNRNTGVVNLALTTIDSEIQHEWQPTQRHHIVWGGGYRWLGDNLQSKPVSGVSYLAYTPEESTNSLYNIFAQDKITLLPGQLFLTLGTKLEHNYYTGWENQPSGRLTWTPTHNQTIWTSVARAVRIPSRAERSIRLTFDTLGVIPIKQIGTPNFDSEKMIAYEVGYRVKPEDTVSIDISSFYNNYDNLRSYEQNGTPNIPLANKAFGDTYGLETSAEWRVMPNWNLSAGYSLLFMQLHVDPDSKDTTSVLDEDASPRDQIKLGSHVNLTPRLEWDTLAYWTAGTSYRSSGKNIEIPDYTRLDMRLGWKIKEGVSVSLVGQNLLDDHHQEFAPALYSVTNEISRSVYGNVTIKF